MKKILSFFMIFVLLFLLSSCNENNDRYSNETTKSKVQTKVPEETQNPTDTPNPTDTLSDRAFPILPQSS